MRNVLGILMILGAVVFGVYAGLWWAFIGGIVQIVEAVKADPVSAMDIALGIVRVVFAGAIGGFSFFALAAPGVAMLKP